MPEQVPTLQHVQKTVEVAQTQCIDKVVGMPVVTRRQTPLIQVVSETLETTQIQFIDKVVDVPHIMQQQTSVSRTDRDRPTDHRANCGSSPTRPARVHTLPSEDDTDLNYRLAPQKRKSISETGMTEDEPSESDVRRASASSCEVSCETHTSSKGRSAGLKWTRHERGAQQREGRISICSTWRQTWRSVTPTSRSRQERSESLTGPKTCARSAG